MSNNKNETFCYTYSATEQAEIQNIRKKYTAPEESKMEQLRRLDASVTRKGTIIAIAIGVIGALILGLGMSCVMVWDGLFIPGIIIGILGIICIIAAYPIYIRIIKKQREKLAPEIMRLTDELMK